MKSITRTLIVLVIAITGLASCSHVDPEGLWDKMKWNAPKSLVKENGIYIVPAEGGEYTFECTNYSGVWLSHIEDNGEIVYPVYPVYPANEHEDFLSFKGDRFGVNCDRGHVIVNFEALEQGMDTRDITVGVTAGDIFDSFKFTQQR